MHFHFLAGISSFFVAAIFLPFVISYSTKKNFVSRPGRRRIHTRRTPSLGGVAIFLGFTLSSIFWLSFYDGDKPLLLLAILIVPFILGLLDDLTHLKPKIKLLGQFIAALLVFFFLKVHIKSGYELIDISFTPLVQFIVTASFLIIFTNAYNLVDGIDGLAGSTALVSLLFLGIFFHLTHTYTWAFVCFAFAGGVIAFLIKNWEPSKIFMGDTGSLVIGTVLAILLIEFINTNAALPSNSTFKVRVPVVMALSVVIIPAIDTTRIILIRLAKRESIFKPDKRHIHHALIRLGMSHSAATLLLTSVQISFIGISFLLSTLDPRILLLLLSFLATTLCLLLDHLLIRRTYN